MFPPSSLAFEVCRLEPASPWGLPCIYPWISAATWLEAWQPQPWSLRPTPHLFYDTSHLTLPCAFVPMKPNLIGYLPSSFPGSGIKCEFSILPDCTHAKAHGLSQPAMCCSDSDTGAGEENQGGSATWGAEVGPFDSYGHGNGPPSHQPSLPHPL